MLIDALDADTFINAKFQNNHTQICRQTYNSSLKKRVKKALTQLYLGTKTN